MKQLVLVFITVVPPAGSNLFHDMLQTCVFPNATKHWFSYIRAFCHSTLVRAYFPSISLHKGDVLVQNIKHFKGKARVFISAPTWDAASMRIRESSEHLV